ncbi:MAG: CapA family protein [Lachnospiraceae bacterium]|nr:CapA family protein [Lachnospiraceae bacterium]
MLALLCVAAIGISGCGQIESGRADALPDETVVLDKVAEIPMADATTDATTDVTTDATTDTTTDVTETISKPASVTLIMVGDVLLHTPVEESSHREDGSYNYDALFAHTRERIEAADLALVNQEVIIGGEELGITGYPSFNAAFSLCDALVDTGFDVICHATNHALDKGKKGVVACSEYWEEHYPDITVLGIHSQESTSTAYGAEPFLYTVKGEDGDALTIAILNYTYGTNGIALPADMPYAVDLLEEERVIADIQAAESKADFTVCCPHWGTEYRLTPDAYQEKWTQIFLENGVDLVLGTHPHVIEPIEWVQDGESGQEMLVYYSLGNFVNWTSGTGEGVANRMVGGMAEVTITKDETGKACISDFGVEALVTHVEPGRDGVTTFFLTDYPRKMAEDNAIIAQDAAFSRDYCEELCDKVWGDIWRK